MLVEKLFFPPRFFLGNHLKTTLASEAGPPDPASRRPLWYAVCLESLPPDSPDMVNFRVYLYIYLPKWIACVGCVGEVLWCEQLQGLFQRVAVSGRHEKTSGRSECVRKSSTQLLCARRERHDSNMAAPECVVQWSTSLLHASFTCRKGAILRCIRPVLSPPIPLHFLHFYTST